MAESTGPKKGWKKVRTNYQVQGGALRDAAAVTVNAHGKSTGNVGASNMIYRTAIVRGVDPSKDFLIDVGVDEERELIAVWATAESTPGTSAIRRYQNGASSWVSFHIGGAFLEAPDLRPTIKKVQVLVYEELDEEGLPVMVIPIKSGKAKISQSRDKAETTPGAQAAPSDNSEPFPDDDDDDDDPSDDI